MRGKPVSWADAPGRRCESTPLPKGEKANNQGVVQQYDWKEGL